MNEVKNTAIFLHVATIGEYNQVMNEVLDALSSSGISSETSFIEVNVVGNGIVTVNKSHDNLRINKISDDVRSFEHPTLERVRQFSIDNLGWNVLYLNCLGGRHKGHGKLIRFQWRQMLYSVLLEKRDLCRKTLHSYDVCGVEWRQLPMPHMTSNNWWASTTYLAKLPKLVDFANTVAACDFSSFGGGWNDTEIKRRHSAEFWIGAMNNVRPFDLFKLAALPLPIDKKLGVRWWDLPGINWKNAARWQSEGQRVTLPGLVFYTQVIKYKLRVLLGAAAKVGLVKLRILRAPPLNNAAFEMAMLRKSEEERNAA